MSVLSNTILFHLYSNLNFKSFPADFKYFSLCIFILKGGARIWIHTQVRNNWICYVTVKGYQKSSRLPLLSRNSFVLWLKPTAVHI